MARAREITFVTYTLHPGAVENALVAAARRGARVTVRLEGQPYADALGEVHAQNEQALRALSAAGADARLQHAPGSTDAPLHLKAIVADRQLFLDDRNFDGDGEEAVLRDDFSADRAAVENALAGNTVAPSPFFAVHKHEALASEARLLYSARANEDVVVESESFGAYNGVYRALDDLAKEGRHPRVLITRRELESNPKEQASVSTLASDGALIRITDADEKFALVGARAWLGSANATAAFDRPDQLDWGIRTDAAPIVHQLRDAFERRWQSAQPFNATEYETGPAHCDP